MNSAEIPDRGLTKLIILFAVAGIPVIAYNRANPGSNRSI